MLVPLLLLLLFPRSTTPCPDHLGPGDHHCTLEHGGRTRTYHVHVPPRATRSFPVLIAFHGGGSSGLQFKGYAGIDALADREGILAVYPDGTGSRPDRLLTWNAGGCCGYARIHDVDDVAFVKTMLDDVAGRVSIDRSRVYLTGHSNGGMMSYRMAVEASDVIAAAAPVAGSMVVPQFTPSRPVPILHIHSVDDPRALYGGGLGPPFPLTNQRSFHSSVMANLTDWAKYNGCPDTPHTLKSVRGKADSRSRDHTAELIEWGPCTSGAPVRHWRLVGPGHGWPGSAGLRAEAILGPATDVIDATEEIWRFLREYRNNH